MTDEQLERIEGLAIAMRGPDACDVAGSWMESAPVVLALIAALQEARADAPDAARWRSLWACQRIRVVGSADLGTPDALLGLDFHRIHPDRDDAESRRTLLAFVDAPQPKRDPTAAIAKLRDLMADLPPVDVAAELLEIRDDCPDWLDVSLYDAVVAERDEAIATLRRWRTWIVGYLGDPDAGCPECGVLAGDTHDPGCPVGDDAAAKARGWIR